MMLFYGVGDSSVDGSNQYDNTAEWGAKRGQVPVSVHPAQLPNVLYVGESAGLPGIPFNLDLQAHEASFTLLESGQTYGVRGKGESKVGDDNVIEFDSGTGMLGHSVILRRDSAVDGLGHAKVVMSTATEGVEGNHIQMTIETEDFPRANHRAFVPETNNVAGGWAVAADICHDHMELYSDFDYLSSKELNLGLSVADNGDTIATNDVFRSRLPGYIAIAVASGVPAGPIGATGVYRFPTRKRVRVDEAAMAPAAEEGGQAE
jgi:hypothetical protein